FARRVNRVSKPSTTRSDGSEERHAPIDRYHIRTAALGTSHRDDSRISANPARASPLIACRVAHVAMEAAGVYWIPVFEILDLHEPRRDAAAVRRFRVQIAKLLLRHAGPKT